MAADTGRGSGAVAARQSGNSRPAWLIPVAILVLALIAIAIALLLLNRNDKSDKKGVDVKNDKQGQLAPPVHEIVLPIAVHI